MLAICVVLSSGFAWRLGLALHQRLQVLPERSVQPRPVAVIPLEPRPFSHTVPIAGTLAPLRSVDVFPKLGGKVVALHVALGQRVEAGQRLAQVEATEYGLQARQAEVGLQLAEQAQAQAARSMQRLEEIKERRAGLISAQTMEEATLQAEAAQRQREQARLQRDLARRIVGNAVIEAPIAGVITRVYVEQGAMVGTEYPAFHIDDTSELEVRCEVGDLDLPQISVGQEARLWSDALPGATIGGRVKAVSPALDAWTRRAPVEIAVPNPEGSITGNLFARGEIVVRVEPAALVLPLDVVERTVDGARVQLVQQGHVVEVPVRVAAESQRELVVEGVAAGAQVIVPGAERLAAGDAVRVVESQPASPPAASAKAAATGSPGNGHSG